LISCSTRLTARSGKERSVIEKIDKIERTHLCGRAFFQLFYRTSGECFQPASGAQEDVSLYGYGVEALERLSPPSGIVKMVRLLAKGSWIRALWMKSRSGTILPGLKNGRPQNNGPLTILNTRTFYLGSLGNAPAGAGLFQLLIPTALLQEPLVRVRRKSPRDVCEPAAFR
jgi:hypothetical protein